MSALTDIIAAAAQRYGQNPSALLRVGQIESGLNPSAYNASSGAAGLYQFIPSTAAHYGLSNPQDPVAAADAGAHLMADNAAFLAKRLGRAPTDGELYLAHQQGAAGAAKLLASPDAPAASVVGAKAVTANGGSVSQTAGQFAQMWTDKFAGVKPGQGVVMPAAAMPQQSASTAAALPAIGAGPDLSPSVFIPGGASPTPDDTAPQALGQATQARRAALLQSAQQLFVG